MWFSRSPIGLAKFLCMDSLFLTAEDRFVIIDLATQELAPDALTVGNLGHTAAKLAEWDTIWDLRGTDGRIYNDIIDAYREAVDYDDKKPTVLVSPESAEAVEGTLRANLPPHAWPVVLRAEQKPLFKRPLDLTMFGEDWDAEMLEGLPPLLESGGYQEAIAKELEEDACTAAALGVVGSEQEAFEYVDQLLADQYVLEMAELVYREVQAERSEALKAFLTQIASNSLLAQMALVHEAGRISVVPLHTNSTHRMDLGEEALVVRPARRGAPSQWAKFASAIAELEELLNTPGVHENDIEQLLRRHPLFLRGLNYTQAYHQVILPLEENPPLNPDIIAEPIPQEWCDVIDLKLRDEPVFVGPADRPRLSHAIGEAAAQLRQYA